MFHPFILYIKNQGHISVLSIWETPENPDPPLFLEKFNYGLFDYSSQLKIVLQRPQCFFIILKSEGKIFLIFGEF